jgi:ribosomal protein S18 acetylase RimI-like enzyme
MEVETVLNGPVTVREATIEDIPFMRAMIWEAILASPNQVAHYGLETLQQFEDQYWSRWTKHPDPAFVANAADGRKLGAITMKANNAGKPVRSWRVGIGVETDARGQGVGQHLLERAIVFARENGADYVSLFVDPTNSPAIALYQRTGFVAVGEKDQLIEMRIRF